jgi:hypothetical protein
MKAPNQVRIRTRSSAAGSNASIPAAQTPMPVAGVEVDVTVRRWEALFGTEARHAETGLTFAEMKRQRENDLTVARRGGEAGHVKG